MSTIALPARPRWWHHARPRSGDCIHRQAARHHRRCAAGPTTLTGIGRSAQAILAACRRPPSTRIATTADADLGQPYLRTSSSAARSLQCSLHLSQIARPPFWPRPGARNATRRRDCAVRRPARQISVLAALDSLTSALSAASQASASSCCFGRRWRHCPSPASASSPMKRLRRWPGSPRRPRHRANRRGGLRLRHAAGRSRRSASVESRTTTVMSGAPCRCRTSGLVLFVFGLAVIDRNSIGGPPFPACCHLLVGLVIPDRATGLAARIAPKVLSGASRAPPRRSLRRPHSARSAAWCSRSSWARWWLRFCPPSSRRTAISSPVRRARRLQRCLRSAATADCRAAHSRATAGAALVKAQHLGGGHHLPGTALVPAALHGQEMASHHAACQARPRPGHAADGTGGARGSSSAFACAPQASPPCRRTPSACTATTRRIPPSVRDNQLGRRTAPMPACTNRRFSSSSTTRSRWCPSARTWCRTRRSRRRGPRRVRSARYAGARGCRDAVQPSSTRGRPTR